jgi:hypothetical protein
MSSLLLDGAIAGLAVLLCDRRTPTSHVALHCCRYSMLYLGASGATYNFRSNAFRRVARGRQLAAFSLEGRKCLRQGKCVSPRLNIDERYPDVPE